MTEMLTWYWPGVKKDAGAADGLAQAADQAEHDRAGAIEDLHAHLGVRGCGGRGAGQDELEQLGLGDVQGVLILEVGCRQCAAGERLH